MHGLTSASYWNMKYIFSLISFNAAEYGAPNTVHSRSEYTFTDKYCQTLSHSGSKDWRGNRVSCGLKLDL